MIKNKISSPINQWIEINKELKLYQYSTIFLTVLTLFLCLLVYLTIFPDPIVIKENGINKTYFIGKHIPITPDKNDIKIFLKNFIKLRYEIRKSNLGNTVESIKPLSTKGYILALEKEIGKEKSESKLSKIDQYVANIEITITKKNVIAQFDKIIRFNGVPLIIPTEVSFQLTKETPTRWNPYGIFVNGVIEHEKK